MAAIVKTRSSRQCKSHHQKLIQKFKNIDKILSKLTESLETQSSEYELTSSRYSHESCDLVSIEPQKS